MWGFFVELSIILLHNKKTALRMSSMSSADSTEVFLLGGCDTDLQAAREPWQPFHLNSILSYLPSDVEAFARGNVEVRLRLSVPDAQSLTNSIASDTSVGGAIIEAAVKHLQTKQDSALVAGVSTLVSWGLAYDRVELQDPTTPQLSCAVCYFSVSTIPPPICHDSDGCRFAQQVSKGMKVTQNEGYAPRGDFYFNFHSTTTAPLSLKNINFVDSPQLRETLERYGFECCDHDRDHFQLSPARTRGGMFVLFCWNRAVFVQCQHVFGALLSACFNPMFVHCGQLQADCALAAALWPLEIELEKLCKSHFLKIIERNATKLCSENATLTNLGLHSCETTAELFEQEKMLHQEGHHGRSLVWLVEKFVHRMFTVATCCGLLENLDACSTKKVAASWSETPVVIRLVKRAETIEEEIKRNALQSSHAQLEVLFHGTSAGNAESILQSFIDVEQCAKHCDFGGNAFYTTTSAAYAISAACATSGSAAKAVIALVANNSNKKFESYRIQDTLEWQCAVTAYRRVDSRLKNALSLSVTGAEALTGWISRNATEIECGGAAEPLAEEQTAFRIAGLHQLRACSWFIFFFQ